MLKAGGVLIRVIPLARHLWGMKEVLYEHPYENAEERDAPSGFLPLGMRRVEYTAEIDGAHIADLFTMTPYFYRTDRAGREELAALGSLRTEIAFGILTYRKQ